MADLYMRLTYDEYKDLERQMREFAESTHYNLEEAFYHKAFRLKLPPINALEILGPSVPQPGEK